MRKTVYLILVSFVKIGLVKAILWDVDIFLFILSTVVKFFHPHLLTTHKFLPPPFRFRTSEYMFSIRLPKHEG
jgi:hypothetical protein